MEKSEILICECHSSEHQIIITYCNEDNIYYGHIHLTNRSFWSRLVNGIKFIFGYKCKYGHWDEFVFTNRHSDKLIEMGNKMKTAAYVQTDKGNSI